MPKIYIHKGPTDLYRYKTFAEVLFDNSQNWGAALDYDSKEKEIQKYSNFLTSKLYSIRRFITVFNNIFKADYVYVPPMTVGIGFSDKLFIWTCNLLRKKVIFDFYISLYDTNVLDRKRCNPDSKEARKYKKVDYWGNTRLITIYLNPCEAKRYRKLSGLGIGQNVRIIPLSITERLRAKIPYYSNPDKRPFNIVWWGTYIPLHGLKKIIDAMSIIQKVDTNVYLYILGNNEELSREYKSYIDNYGNLSNNVKIYNDLTFTNGKMQPFLNSECDLAMGAFGNSEKSRTVILNKAIEAVAMRIPVLTQYSEAFEDYFPQGESIYYCNNDPESIANSILEIKNNTKDEIVARTQKAYDIYKLNFSIESTKEKFSDILKELL